MFRSILLALLFAFARSTEIPVEWINAAPYADQPAEVGDKVTFTYSSSHNVWLHEDDDTLCEDADGVLVGDSDASPATYTFSEAGTFVFVCRVGSHCAGDKQYIRFVISEPADDDDDTCGFGFFSICFK